MNNERFSDAQIMAVLKQAEGGAPVSELCREDGMSSASFYKWRAKFGGMDASLMSERKDMAEENRRLKRMYAEMSMQNDLLKEALGKSVEAVSASRTSRDIAFTMPYRSTDGHECGATTRRKHRVGVPGVRHQ
jgi:putative transposase